MPIKGFFCLNRLKNRDIYILIQTSKSHSSFIANSNFSYEIKFIDHKSVLNIRKIMI